MATIFETEEEDLPSKEISKNKFVIIILCSAGIMFIVQTIYFLIALSIISNNQKCQYSKSLNQTTETLLPVK